MPVEKGLDKNVAHFIQLGVDVNAPDSQESTALHFQHMAILVL